MLLLLLLLAACSGSADPSASTSPAPSTSSSPDATPPAPTEDTPSASPAPTEDTPSASPAPTEDTAGAITIDGFAFTPADLTVRVGDTVTWTNEEDSLHTVTAGAPDARSDLFDSGEFDTGETFEFVFAEAGTFAYFCDRHEFMRGEVIVEP